MRDTLSAYTTLGIGGRARRIAVAHTRDELIDEINDKSAIAIGGGSNILASDAGYDGTVVVNRYRDVKLQGVLCVCGSGVRLTKLADFLCENGLSGLEWACGIPGTVGGAVRMNAGAFGGSISDVVVYADVLRDGKLLRLSKRELGLGYRSSALDRGDTVISAAFGLRYADPPTVKKKCEAFAARRRASQPIGRSAGSVFKNPDGIYIGRVLDELGFKGYRSGGAVVSPLHANIIVNAGGATARDVCDIISAQKRALSDIGIAAEEEIIYLGDFP